MIKSHQHFDINEMTTIEKLVIETPYRFSVNYHNQACFIYSINKGIESNYYTNEGQFKGSDIVLLNCGNYVVDLSNQENSECEVILIHLRYDLLRMLFETDFPKEIKYGKSDSFSHNINSDEIIRSYMSNLLFYFNNSSILTEEIIRVKIKELILILIKTKNSKSISELMNNLFSHTKISLKETIHNHLFEDLSLEHLADLCNLSLSTFKREFKKAFNETPAHYIKSKRLEKAETLLVNSDMPISEISYICQFKDESHFTRAFKQVYLNTPSNYRSSHRI